MVTVHVAAISDLDIRGISDKVIQGVSLDSEHFKILMLELCSISL